MSESNQEGQNINKQININRGDYVEGDVVHGDKNVYSNIVNELEPILKQVQEAKQSGELDESTALEVESSLTEATREASKDNPDKATITEHLDKVKTLIDKGLGYSTTATALAVALAAACARIMGLF